jgi:hypothetical protein
VASGSERTMEFWFFLLGCCSIQKFSAKMNFADNLVTGKLETHYPMFRLMQTAQRPK